MESFSGFISNIEIPDCNHLSPGEAVYTSELETLIRWLNLQDQIVSWSKLNSYLKNEKATLKLKLPATILLLSDKKAKAKKSLLHQYLDTSENAINHRKVLISILNYHIPYRL